MPHEITPHEIRTFEVRNLKIETRDGGARKITGHAAVFNVIGDGGWFREQIAPGAFAETILQDDIRALINHDSNYVLGRNTATTLALREDEKGLVVDIAPPDTQAARDLIVSMERGDINQMSFAFQIIKASWEYSEGDNGKDLRTVEKVKLFDVSVVTYPFYESTDASVRSHAAWRKVQKRKYNKAKTKLLLLKLMERN